MPRQSTSAAPRPTEAAQDAICLLVAEKAREGKSVVRLKWGDPFVFDSGGKEALFLHEQGIPFEVVPGIPALVGIPAYAGIPVTYPGCRRHTDVHPWLRTREEATPDLDWHRWRCGRDDRCATRDPATRARGCLAAGARATGRRLGGNHLLRHARRSNGHCPARLRACRSNSMRTRRRSRQSSWSVRRWGSRSPSLVRRASPVRYAHRRHAVARTGRRVRGAPRAISVPMRSKRRQSTSSRSTTTTRWTGPSPPWRRITGSCSPARTVSTTSCAGRCHGCATSATCTARASARSVRQRRSACSGCTCAST